MSIYHLHCLTHTSMTLTSTSRIVCIPSQDKYRAPERYCFFCWFLEPQHNIVCFCRGKFLFLCLHIVISIPDFTCRSHGNMSLKGGSTLLQSIYLPIKNIFLLLSYLHHLSQQHPSNKNYKIHNIHIKFMRSIKVT